MKSKSFEPKNNGAAKSVTLNKTYGFVGYYKSEAETNASFNKQHSESLKDSTKRDRSPNKKKTKGQPADVSFINIDGQSLNPGGRSSPINQPKVTSTPKVSGKSQNKAKVKSIMKTSLVTDDDAMDSSINLSEGKSKKRNKSVSFMLEDTEEVAVKKTKSDESSKISKKHTSSYQAKTVKSKDEVKKKLKNIKKNLQAEKENKLNSNISSEPNIAQSIVSDKKPRQNAAVTNIGPPHAAFDSPSESQSYISRDKKKKLKLNKRKKLDESSEPTENESFYNEEASTEQKVKKFKKKKHFVKTVPTTDTTETEGEPVTKTSKKDVKPDIIAEDLENLSIGDNAHTLINLLDEMTVVDKDKKKKNKLRRKKDKIQKTTSVSSGETEDLEKIDEGKEKIKWKKRKWNKDKKGDVDENGLTTSVIVENLPLTIMFSYKKLLIDHFGKLGLIKNIGVAELYSTEELKPVFTTTINFYSEGAAMQALEEDNTLLEKIRIRVKRPLPPTQTTVVVRSYGELAEHALSSAFRAAGRVRSIRNLVKGRKAMATAFIEFDGPEAVENALKMADAKIGGKKIHVSKFELRAPKHKQPKKKLAESENEGDSEESND